MKLSKLPSLPALPALPKLSRADAPDLPELPSLPAPGAGLLPEQPVDPLAGFEPTGDLEADAAGELSAALSAFKERTDNEQKRFKLAVDTEYWFCVCFQSREQKDAFLAAMEWTKIGDKYLDGTKVAKKLGVKLPPRGAAYNVSARVDRRLNDLTDKDQ